MYHSLRTASPVRGGKNGYTLLEILVATTLSLLLMYGVAAVFSQVGSLMTQTQNVMGMSNSLRSARDRLAEDLSLLTVPKLKAPTSRYGFFCYTEGLGADDKRIVDATLAATDVPPVRIPQNNTINIEEGGFDGTVGDTDDILSFTARAKQGEWFRGRFQVVEKDPETGNPTGKVVEQIIESEYAEVIWFVRGTTLYRRVLLIVPDDVLQKSLSAMMGNCPHNIRQGYGFFKYYDVSVHLDHPDDPDNAKIVANTVADLANRKNRYGYWSSPVLGTATVLFDPRHGAGMGTDDYYGSWYWLRLPTLRESASVPADPAGAFSTAGYFRAGVPFGNDQYWGDGTDDRWDGEFQRLSMVVMDRVLDSTGLPESNADYADNDFFAPFIDLWNDPNPWEEVEPDTGDLRYALSENNGSSSEAFDQDILMTNVLSFDVKAWDDDAGRYVDLGNRGRLVDISATDQTEQTYSNLVRAGVADETIDEANRFDDFGRYKYNDPLNFTYPAYGIKEGDSVAVQLPDRFPDGVPVLRTPFLPAVFDTWTEEYELEQLRLSYQVGSDFYDRVSRRNGYSPSDIPLDAEVTSAMLPDYPPPYDKELKAISIELRVFDPVSRAIKNTTLNVDLTKR